MGLVLIALQARWYQLHRRRAVVDYSVCAISWPGPFYDGIALAAMLAPMLCVRAFVQV